MGAKAELAAKLARVKELKAIDRDYTSTEVAEINQLVKDIDGLHNRMDKDRKAADAISQLGAGVVDDEDDDDDGIARLFGGGSEVKGFMTGLARPDATLAPKLARKMARFGADFGARTKSLVPSGEVVESVPLQSDSPIADGRVVS